MDESRAKAYFIGNEYEFKGSNYKHKEGLYINKDQEYFEWSYEIYEGKLSEFYFCFEFTSDHDHTYPETYYDYNYFIVTKNGNDVSFERKDNSSIHRYYFSDASIKIIISYK